jgi:hypothetical protein
MSDDELLKLLKSIDPLAVRLPQGIKRIVNAAIDKECAELREENKELRSALIHYDDGGES